MELNLFQFSRHSKVENITIDCMPIFLFLKSIEGGESWRLDHANLNIFLKVFSVYTTYATFSRGKLYQSTYSYLKVGSAYVIKIGRTQ